MGTGAQSDWSLENNVDTGTYDSVFALTGKMLNDAVDSEWQPSTMPPFQINTTNASISDAVFEEPQILIFADENGLPRVTYRVWFTTGALTITSLSDKTTTSSYDLSTCFFTLDAEIESEACGGGPGSPKWNEIANSLVDSRDVFIEQVNVVPISVPTFSKCFWSDSGHDDQMTQGVVTGTAFTDWEQSAMDLSGQNFISQIAVYARQAFIPLVAYVVSSKLDGPHWSMSPSQRFLPAYVQYLPYLWKDPNNGQVSHDPINIPLNCLMILGTSRDSAGNVKLPAGAPVLPAMACNWTNGTINPNGTVPLNIHGTYVSSGTFFMSSFFIPRIRELNYLNELTFRNLVIDDTNWWCDWSVGTHFPKDPYSSYYDYVPSSANGGVISYTFTSQYNLTAQSMLQHINRPNDPSPGKERRQGSVSCTNLNTVTYQLGSNQVVLKGVITVNFMVDGNPSGMTGGKIEGEDMLWGTIEWTVKYNLASINDGGLSINTDYQVVTNLQCSYSTSFMNNTPYFDAWKNSIGQSYLAADRQAYIKGLLNAEFNTANKCVLPAAGTFEFKDPRVGRDGSLVCDVSYEANALPSSPTPDVSSPLPAPAFGTIGK